MQRGPADFMRADSGRLDRPVLCVIIDTEEDFDWAEPFSRSNVSVSSMEFLGRGQAIFDSFGVRPTYLVDFPVAANSRTADILGPWLETERCLVGAQLHPWVNPPDEEVVCPYNSFPCNLPELLERRKIAALKSEIEAKLGRSPQVYKAGRYGLDIRRESTLRELGFLVDTSVVPYRSYAGAGGGPDFFAFPDQPFWSSTGRDILYLPVSHHLVGRLRRSVPDRLLRFGFGRMAERAHVPAVMSRLGLLERIMLTPEGVSLDEMRKLVCELVQHDYRVFALSLHSPSFMPGRTPYIRSAEDLDKLQRKLNGFLEFFFGEVGGRQTDPLQLRQLLHDGGPA